MLLTLAECKADRGIKNVVNVSPNTPDFADKINAACRKALRRGDWDGTVIPIYTCVRKGCVVWPRYVHHVRHFNVCGTRPLPMHNLWYKFLDHSDRNCWMGWIGGCWSTNRLDAQGYSPVYSDIMGSGRKVRIYHQLALDLGKAVTIFGIDDDTGQPLRHNNGDGTWSDGVILKCQLPYAQTTMNVRSIDRIIKDETQGNITMFAFDATNNVLEDLAVYEPSETNPEYEKFQIRMPCFNTTTPVTGSCGVSQGVVALVKLKMIPAKVDTDLVYLQNLEALKLFIQSMNSNEAGDRESAIGFEKDAIRELNLDLWDRDGEDKIPVNFGELGNTGVGMQRLF